MRLSRKQGLASVSPWVLAAACGLLTIIIVVFAVNNYRREKVLMTDVLLERGATIIRFVTSGARASLLRGIREGGISPWQWASHVQIILEHASEHPGVHFISLLDRNGIILASSDKDAVGKKVDELSYLFVDTLLKGKTDPGEFHYRMDGTAKSSAFQVATLFKPLDRRILENHFPGTSKILDAKHQGKRPMDRHHDPFFSFLQDVKKLGKKKRILLVELDLQQFNKAVKQQRLQIVVLSVVLLLVGIGGWLSLLTLERLKGSQSRLSMVKAFRDILITSLPLGLIATDRNGNIRICNQFAEQICSVEESKAIGGLPDEILPPVLANVLISKKTGFGNGDVYHEDVELISKHGGILVLQLTSLSVVDDMGAFAGKMLLIQDLSQVKRLQSELRRNERMAALGKMAAGVAHELRNPLSSIKGLTVLLSSHFQEESSDKETADVLVHEVDRLNRSISELLDYSRPHKLQKKPCDLKKIVAEALALIRIDAESVGVEIVQSMDEKVSQVQIDQDKIKQVFLNLFLNSIQAMNEGGSMIVSIYEKTASLYCTVKDTGCGLDSLSQLKVFDPYFTTKPEGTGLGLAMSAKIIEEHGGSISLKSEQGVGTTVTIVLPC